MPLSTITADAAHAPQVYAAHGVVLVPRVISSSEIDEIRTAFTREVEASTSLGYAADNIPADDILARYPRFVHPHRHPSTAAGALARRLMMDPRLTSIVSSLTGDGGENGDGGGNPGVYGAQSMFYFKPPSARGQDLHQDNISLRASPGACIAAWIAVDDCDAENGALLVVPGSHGVQLICPNELSDVNESFSKSRIAVPGGVETVQTEMKAGDVLFFHGHTVHGSKRNVSRDRFRRSLIYHYVGRDVQMVSDFYFPLIGERGEEFRVGAAEGGGACGEAWERGI